MLVYLQNLVGAFVDHQNQAYAKVKALEDEIESHRRHILTLKRELSDAVRREYEEEVCFNKDSSLYIYIKYDSH